MAAIIRARPPRMSAVFTLAFAVGGFAIGIRPLRDNSFMWHLRTGHLILTRGIPHADPYSFTAAGTHWVAQSWLAELLYGIVDSVAGAFGLRLLGALVGAIVAVLLFQTAWRVTCERTRAFGLAIVAFAATLNVWSERPLMLGLLAMVLLTWVCELPDSTLGRRPLITIPVLFWLWANVHGTFAVGFVYLAVHLLGRTLEGAAPTRGHERKLLVGGLVATVVTFANPYGPDLVLFPLRLLGRHDVLATVAEWQSPTFRELFPFFFALWILAALSLLARRGAGPRDVLVACVFVLLGLWAIRNVGLAVIATLPVLARAARVPARGADERRGTSRVLAATLVLALVVAVARARDEPDWNLRRYPVDAFRDLRRRELVGARLLTTDAWGGYVIWRAWPAQHVFFDDRYDMYPLLVNDAYDRLAGVQPGWQRVLDRYCVDVVMWPRGGALAQAVAGNGSWVRVHRDRLAVVFVRRTGRGRGLTPAGRGPTPACRGVLISARPKPS